MADQSGAIIDTLFGALGSGDLDTALACLGPNATVWHSFDGISMDREAARAGWQDLVAGFPERAFVDVRRQAIPGGFVQQHMMAARTPAGNLIAWPVCVIVRVENGLISRIEEYIDRAGRFAVDDLRGAKTPGL